MLSLESRAARAVRCCLLRSAQSAFHALASKILQEEPTSSARAMAFLKSARSYFSTSAAWMTPATIRAATSAAHASRLSRTFRTFHRDHQESCTLRNRSITFTDEYANPPSTPYTRMRPPSRTQAASVFVMSPATASNAAHAPLPAVISFTLATTSSSPEQITSSAPSAFSSAFCSARRTTLISLIPQCRATEIACLPSVDPAALCIRYSPSGTGCSSFNMEYAVQGLITICAACSSVIPSGSCHTYSSSRHTYSCHDPLPAVIASHTIGWQQVSFATSFWAGVEQRDS